MEDFRLLILMKKPERGDLHFTAVVWRGAVYSADQRPDRVDPTSRFI